MENKIILTMNQLREVIQIGLDENKLLFDMADEALLHELVAKIDQEEELFIYKQQLEQSTNGLEQQDIKNRITELEKTAPSGKTINALYKALKNITRVEFNATMFSNGKYRVLSFRKYTPNGEVSYSTTSMNQLIQQLVHSAPAIKTHVSKIISQIFQILDVSCGYVFNTEDETIKDVVIEKFAKNIDAQAGEGAFAAYLLYPDLYNSNIHQLGLKRHFMIGKKASTGKSIMGKLLLTLYGMDELATSRSYRPEASKSGYDADTVSWNESVLGWPIVNIDDDIAQSTSQEDFLKNFYNKGYIKTGNGKIGYQYHTFDGFVSMNVNTFPDRISAIEISKRVYVIKLTKAVETYLTPDEIVYLHEFHTTKNTAGLINYLNVNREKALHWLTTYTQPDLSFDLGQANKEVIEFIIQQMEELNSDRIMLKTVSSQFVEIKKGDDVEFYSGGMFKTKAAKYAGQSRRCIVVANEKKLNEYKSEHLQSENDEGVTELTTETYSDDDAFTLQLMLGVKDGIDISKRTITTMNGFVEALQDETRKEMARIETYGQVPRGSVEDATVEELGEWKDVNKNVLKMFNTVNYKRSGSAKRDNIENTHFIMMDIDETDKTIEELTDILNDKTDFDYILTTSLRDKVNATKVHLLIPTSEPINDTDVYRATWTKLSEFLQTFGVNVDPAVKDMGRRTFIATSGRAFISRTTTGKGVVPDYRTASEVKVIHDVFNSIPVSTKTVADSVDRVSSTTEGNRNDTLNKELFKLAQRGATYEELKMVADASPVTGHELEATFKSATNLSYNK